MFSVKCSKQIGRQNHGIFNQRPAKCNEVIRILLSMMVNNSLKPRNKVRALIPLDANHTSVKKKKTIHEGRCLKHLKEN